MGYSGKNKLTENGIVGETKWFIGYLKGKLIIVEIGITGIFRLKSNMS